MRETRITVWGLVEWRRMQKSDEWIRQSIPGLTQADLEAAWEYYAENANEINEAIRLNAKG